MRHGFSSAPLRPMLAAVCILSTCFAAHGGTVSPESETGLRDLEADLKGLTLALKSYTSSAGLQDEQECSVGLSDSTSKQWADFLRKDSESLVRGTRLLIRAKRAEIKDLEVNRLIFEISRLRSRIESLQDCIHRLIGAFPDWTMLVPESPVLGSASHEPTDSMQEAKSLTRSLLKDLSLDLDEALRSRRQSEAAQLEAVEALSALRASLMSDRQAYDHALAASAQAKEAVLGSSDASHAVSALVSCCRRRLLELVRSSQAQRDKDGSSGDASSLPDRFPPPLRGGDRSDTIRPSEAALLGPSLPVESLEKVFSVARGKVVLSEYVPGFGLTVVLGHRHSESTVFGHLGASFVEAGQVISAGEKIGLSGQTGLAKQPCLLFAVIRNGQFIDPRRRISPPL